MMLVKGRRCVPATVPADDAYEDNVFVSGDAPVDYGAQLIVGAVPAIVAAVARLHPSTMFGLLNG